MISFGVFIPTVDLVRYGSMSFRIRDERILKFGHLSHLFILLIRENNEEERDIRVHQRAHQFPAVGTTDVNHPVTDTQQYTETHKIWHFNTQFPRPFQHLSQMYCQNRTLTHKWRCTHTQAHNLRQLNGC